MSRETLPQLASEFGMAECLLRKLPAAPAKKLTIQQAEFSLEWQSSSSGPLWLTRRLLQKTDPAPVASTCGPRPQFWRFHVHPALPPRFYRVSLPVVALGQGPSLPFRRNQWLAAFSSNRLVLLLSEEVGHGSPAHSLWRPAESGQASEVCQRSSFAAIVEFFAEVSAGHLVEEVVG